MPEDDFVNIGMMLIGIMALSFAVFNLLCG